MAEVQPVSEEQAQDGSGMKRSAEWTDPRVRRTRQMLFEALEHLLNTKGIEQISVADIAEQATLNRATFYDHYSDKFELLEGWVEARFQELLSKRNVVFGGPCFSALTSLTLATCDYLVSLRREECPNHRQMEAHFERAMSAVLRGMLLGGLRDHPPQSGLPPELIAATIGGGIYSAAREWVRTPDRVPVEEVVQSILTLVGPMLMPFQEAAGIRRAKAGRRARVGVAGR